MQRNVLIDGRKLQIAKHVHPLIPCYKVVSTCISYNADYRGPVVKTYDSIPEGLGFDTRSRLVV